MSLRGLNPYEGVKSGETERYLNPKLQYRYEVRNMTKNNKIEIIGDYKVLNGTFYHIKTDDAIISILEGLRQSQIRCRFHWGDTKTGLDWGDDLDVMGRIGRSTGDIKIPLLIHNSRSLGGTGILTHCIVKITHANKKEGGVIYQHPDYHTKE